MFSFIIGLKVKNSTTNQGFGVVANRPGSVPTRPTPNPGNVKGRVWSKVMFCVWLAFAVKIVGAMTEELNLAYSLRDTSLDSQTVMTSLPSPSLGRALYNTYNGIRSPKGFRGA